MEFIAIFICIVGIGVCFWLLTPRALMKSYCHNTLIYICKLFRKLHAISFPNNQYTILENKTASMTYYTFKHSISNKLLKRLEYWSKDGKKNQYYPWVYADHIIATQDKKIAAVVIKWLNAGYIIGAAESGQISDNNGNIIGHQPIFLYKPKKNIFLGTTQPEKMYDLIKNYYEADTIISVQELEISEK